MEEDPPDPDGVPCDSHTVTKKHNNMPIEIDQSKRKRLQVTNNSAHPQKRLIRDPSQPVPSIQTSYTHPDYIEKKHKYSNTDNAPFIVHVSKRVDDLSTGVVLKPIKFGHFLYHNNIKNVVSDGVKRIGRNRISVEFKSAADANCFIENPALAGAKYDTVIPSYNVTRMGIVRQVPVEWTLEELISSIEVPAGFGSIIKARRFNRKSVNENQSTVWIPSQTVVLTFSGQKLPSNIYCFFTSMPVKPYILQLQNFQNQDADHSFARKGSHGVDRRSGRRPVG
ncbi:unnamed protein product [Parnassius mnemosyne]|uniref:Uncharacterized protein n=1 Tax=Parnassius mnemosyne TaxID=213953 RepID=A0AAV1LQG3_9NEOP